MKKISINDFKRGWIIGNFEPSLLKVDNLEVGLKSYNKGDEDEKHYHKFGTEISFLIVGSASFNGKVLKEGDGMIIYPKESNIFKAITACKVLVIKYPSDAGDKYLGEYND